MSDADDDGIVRCEYCGTESRVTVPRPRVQIPAPSQTAPQAKGRKTRRKSDGVSARWTVLILGGAVLGLGGLWAVLASVDRAHPAPKGSFGLRDMPQKHNSWFEVDLEGIDVKPSKQDATANLEWVERVAHAWSQDAVLTWMQTKVRADGFALDAPLIEYKFISPAKARAKTALRGAGESPPPGLTIHVIGDGVRAFISPNAQGTAETPPVKLTCSFKDLMASATAIGGKAISDQPVHEVRLEHQVGEWAWNIGLSKIYLDPATCAQVESPYARASRR